MGNMNINKTLKLLQSGKKVKYISKYLPVKCRKYYKRWSAMGTKRRDYYGLLWAVLGRGKEGIKKSFKDEEAFLLDFEG